MLNANIKNLFTNGTIPDQPYTNPSTDGAQFGSFTAVNRLVNFEQAAKYYEDWHRLDQSNDARRPIAGFTGVGVNHFGHRFERAQRFETNVQLENDVCFLAAAVRFDDFTNYNLVIGAREGDGGAPDPHWAEIYTEIGSGELRVDLGSDVIGTGVNLIAGTPCVISVEARDGYYRIDKDGALVRAGIYSSTLPKDRPFFVGDTNDLSGSLRFPMAGFVTQMGIARRAMSSADISAIHTAFGATFGLTI